MLAIHECGNGAYMDGDSWAHMLQRLGISLSSAGVDSSGRVWLR